MYNFASGYSQLALLQWLQKTAKGISVLHEYILHLENSWQKYLYIVLISASGWEGRLAWSKVISDLFVW